MTTPAQAPGGPAPHGSPTDGSGPRIALYTEEFAVNPHRVYREMRRRFGALVPIELAPGVPATLVIDYQIARRILNDPSTSRRTRATGSSGYRTTARCCR